MSQKASSSIADRNIEKSVGANKHPCLTPFVIANISETSPPFLTFTIIPVCRLSIMVVNFSGHPYFQRSCPLQKENIYLGNYHAQFCPLFCRWLLCWHPSRLVVYGVPPSVPSVGQISSPVFPYFCWNSVSTWCFSIF